jgi:GNAT superfamily N-acetyltransferase
MTRRSYPDEPAGPFPTPPEQFTDDDGRQIDIERFEGPLSPLVDMYDTFDPADRAQGIPPTGREHIREWLDSIVEDGLNLVAWDDEQAVGHATLVPDRDDDAWELAIFVYQPYQGAGIGRRLICLLLGAAGEAGIERVWLSVERWNHPAIGLYESVGFEPASTDSFELAFTIRLA